jgi:hypothetical protein
LPNPFGVRNTFDSITQGSRSRSNPGLELANAFGVQNEPALFSNGESLRRSGPPIARHNPLEHKEGM